MSAARRPSGPVACCLPAMPLMPATPAAAWGLTTGVIDADALIAALGAVILGEAGEEVLDFYAAERRRVFPGSHLAARQQL